MTTVGYIYLLREREFLHNNLPVYKVGMTNQVANTRVKRLEHYKKGSEIVLLTQIALKAIFRRHSDGCEYFEGDKLRMTTIIQDIVNRYNMSSNRPHETEAGEIDINKYFRITGRYEDFVTIEQAEQILSTNHINMSLPKFVAVMQKRGMKAGRDCNKATIDGKRRRVYRGITVVTQSERFKDNSG